MWLAWLSCSALLLGGVILKMLICHLGFLSISCAPQKTKILLSYSTHHDGFGLGKGIFKGKAELTLLQVYSPTRGQLPFSPPREGTSTCAVLWGSNMLRTCLSQKGTGVRKWLVFRHLESPLLKCKKYFQIIWHVHLLVASNEGAIGNTSSWTAELW